MGKIDRREMLVRTGQAVVGGALTASVGPAWAQLLDGVGAEEEGPSEPVEIPRRPNLLFILADNVRYDCAGYMGHPFVQTPALDQLAAEGVVFSNAFNTTSLCSPSRASILTGMYAHSHGVLNNHTPWTGRHQTFLQELARADYQTAFIGKWHMPGEGLPHIDGIRHFISYTYREGQGSYFDCPLIVDGVEEPSTSYITTEVTDRALRFIDQVREEPGDKPWAIYLSHRTAHPPFASPPGIDGMYDDIDPELPGEADSWFQRTNGNVFQGIMMGSYAGQYRRYCETLTAMDRDIGRLMAALDERGLRDNTVVVYAGDNGMMWGEHRCHGIREPYEEAIRVPLIVRAPGLVTDPGTRRPQMALTIDWAPTFLDLAGLPIPEQVQGQSLVPAVRDAEAAGREDWLLEFWKYFPENTPSYRGVRTANYKYVEFEQSREPWLFDLVADPRERRNLFGQTEHADLLAAMQGRLARFG